MNKMLLCLGVAMLGLFAGCGDDSSAGDTGVRVDGSAPDPIPSGICASYIAQCPTDGLDEAMCVTDCEGATPDFDDCGFRACGVEVGLCDNEVSGDEAILGCMASHGWLD